MGRSKSNKAHRTRKPKSSSASGGLSTAAVRRLIDSTEDDAPEEGTSVSRLADNFSTLAIADEPVRSSSNLSVVPPATSPEYRCNELECQRTFSSNEALLAHKREHHHLFPCDHVGCDKSFKTESDLTKHKPTHDKKKRYQCEFEFCGKWFSYPSELTNHQRKHTGEKPFKCQTCGKCFSFQSSLTTHKILHTGKKPFRCQTCGKYFSQKSHLATHKLSRAHNLRQQNATHSSVRD